MAGIKPAIFYLSIKILLTTLPTPVKITINIIIEPTIGIREIKYNASVIKDMAMYKFNLLENNEAISKISKGIDINNKNKYANINTIPNSKPILVKIKNIEINITANKLIIPIPTDSKIFFTVI